MTGLAEWMEAVEARLPQILPPADERPAVVHEAMRYALLSPGKRLRPVLTLTVAELLHSGPLGGQLGGQLSRARQERILDLACAVEMVHASSLVLDDLPCMDDANLRRGRTTTHRKFGEDMALLAAFGLLNQAFATVAENGPKLKLRRYSTEDMVHHLAQAVGTRGLIGGQALDLRGDPKAMDLEQLEYIHSHKTGALFLAAGELGAMAVDARRRDLELISRYAKNLGLAFQISDDLLDVTATVEETGKDADQDRGKVTFVKLLGVEGARALTAELLGFAIDSLEPLGSRADPLRVIADYVRTRKR